MSRSRLRREAIQRGEQMPVFDRLLDLQTERDVYRAALKLIVAMDYRGNRPSEQRIAQEALDAYPDE